MASVFSTDLITFSLTATDKVDAISQMAQLVVGAGRGSDAEQITKDVLARDEMASTVIGTPVCASRTIARREYSTVCENILMPI